MDGFVFGPRDRFCGAVGEAHGMSQPPYFVALKGLLDRKALSGLRLLLWDCSVGYTHGSTKTVRWTEE